MLGDGDIKKHEGSGRGWALNLRRPTSSHSSPFSWIRVAMELNLTVLLLRPSLTMETWWSGAGRPKWDGYLFQAALEHGPLHVPGGLVAGILLLQPQPGMLIFPQLRAEVL